MARQNFGRRRYNTMSMGLDAIAARQRYEEMQREAKQIRLARMAAKANGTESLLSRMVKLLSRSSRPSQSTERSEKPRSQHQLA
jgi:hypothetical protein